MPLWRDPWALWLALLGLTINLVLVLGLFARLPQLPDLLPVHFNAFGEPDLIEAKRTLSSACQSSARWYGRAT